jgi:NADH dehydrogenase
MHVAIVGGTGFIGTALAERLISEHEVTVISRSPADATLPAAVDRVAADVTDPGTLVGVFSAVDVVVNLVALSPLFTPAGGNVQHDVVHREGTEHLLAAAEDAGVAHFVQMSALGADPEGTTAYIRAKGSAERAVRHSELTSTILRPSVVFGVGGEFISFTRLLAPPYLAALPGGGQTRFQPIYVEDLVTIIVEVIDDPSHREQTYELGGPERLTLAEIARLIHRADGKSVTVLPVPMILARVGLTIGDAIPGVPMGLDQYRSLRLDNVTRKNDIGAFGLTKQDMTRLGEYLGPSGAD